ncbi:MAG: endolytic transglycosylase MltG [Bacteroidota bacterium]|nr:endolytic transglycosylase MltG [Bacteroidota bacterium]MDP3145622.1 endolytic transglycosylase MltG [Bacteroidota bacterium]
MSKKFRSKIVSLIVFALLIYAGYFIYQKFITGTIHLKNKNYTYIFIDSNDTFEDVINDINSENIIDDVSAFEWLAKKMDLDKNIHPGKYRINNGMTKRQIINLIKYNKQEKIKLTLNSQIHTLDEFVTYVSDKLELNEDELQNYLTDEKKLYEDFKLDPDNSFALVVPGVYEVGWAISANDFFAKLKEKYKSIWNETRVAQAKKIGFSIPEVMTLASITQSESGIKSEQEKIASVYINRLNKDMLLQADPTLKFANKNFDVQRVLAVDKEIDSPYNTYKYKGLPPGPICLVSIQAIDAVLNHTKHNFIFFCAKPELNGFSDFSVSYEQHQKYAAAYQKAMNKRGINR